MRKLIFTITCFGLGLAPVLAQEINVQGGATGETAAIPSTGSAGSAEEPVQETAPISLFLDNADIHQIIRIIGDALAINYVVDPTVQGTVNINTAGNLQRSDLLPILETILRINGATMVRTGNFYQIVPANEAANQALPVQDDPQPLLPDDQFVIQLVRMRFVAATEMSTLLRPFLSEGANIVVHETANILLLTERRRNLQKLLEIVDVFDSDVLEGERVRLLPIENSIAEDMAGDLDTIFAGYALAEGRSAVRFVPIERLNSVLVITPNAVVFDEVEKWLLRLDQPRQVSRIRNFIYRVKNAKASDIRNVLSQLYGTQVQLSSIYDPPDGVFSGTGVQPASSPFSGTDPTAQEAVTATVPDGRIKIIADRANNPIIQATAQEYAAIEETILELDILPRQVLIDAQIYEVILDDSISFGLSALLQNRGTLQNPQTTASFAGSPPSLNMQTFAFVGRARELVAFLHASENRSRVRTLSAPSVMVSDNMTAQFQVGAEIPVPTSSSVTPVQSDGTNLFAQTIQFRPTGVIMTVTPQINENGNVTLEIDQEVSQASPNTTSGVVAPVIGKSSVSSTVVVQDGQTIAIAGFIRESQDLLRSRVPLLGRIPVLGVLFGSSSRSTTRTELVILITPHVIRNFEESDLATDELTKKLTEIRKLLP